ncbi:MAG: 50S ribosomal protein L35 [Myxococcota bacterium]|nr:50S ribosomal protein L35 [Myxococcota bacterium]|tara:strand:+ start:361 stop:564 length:204 start_codon:yes stop_codon:yes gene_type:complete
MAKLKLKTKRAAKKRYSLTGKGRVKVGRKGKRHLFVGKSRKRLRNLKGTTHLSAADEPMAKSLIPYG